MNGDETLLRDMLTRCFPAHTEQLNCRFLRPVTRGTVVDAVQNIDDNLYARLVVDYDCSTKVGPLISIQYAVSKEATCAFPSRTATYCFVVDLMNRYHQLQSLADAFKKTWYFDSWMLLGDIQGVNVNKIQVIGHILQVGIPLFLEDSKRCLP